MDFWPCFSIHRLSQVKNTYKNCPAAISISHAPPEKSLKTCTLSYMAIREMHFVMNAILIDFVWARSFIFLTWVEVKHIWTIKHMSYLVSSAASLLVMSDKLVVGFALRLCLTALSDLSDSISDRMLFNSLKISTKLFSNKVDRLSIDTTKTNRTTMHESTHAIATKYTKQRNRSDMERFVGFRPLLDSCSIFANRI